MTIDYIKLYAVDYCPLDVALDDPESNYSTMEIFLREDQAREFAYAQDEGLVFDIFTANFDRSLIYIEDNSLNYEDRSTLFDWRSVQSIKY